MQTLHGAYPQPDGSGKLSSGGRTKGPQTVITPDSTTAEQALGEKGHKLLALHRNGFRIPRFFLVATDGSGDLAISHDLTRHFDALRKPVIARSCHPAEGAQHSFSGMLSSYPDIVTLEHDANGRRRQRETLSFEMPSGLREAYRMIVSDANSCRVQEYLQIHRITDFRPEDMNLLVMEQLDIKVFGMFITASQSDPSKIEIHYEVRDAEYRGRHRTRLCAQDSNGGIVVYDRNADTITTIASIDEIRDALLEFGRTAGKIHDLFSFQQVELAATNDGVYVLQSRSFRISDPNDVPRFPGYQTMERELHAIGYGFYTLPIILVDVIPSAVSNPRLRDDLKQRLREEKTRLNDYILVIKDPWDVVRPDNWSPSGPGKDYTLLNELSRDAKVVIRGRRHNAIRHDEWEHVEKGGITVIPPEETRMMRMFSLDGKGGYGTLTSGDLLSVISNVDGVFVWNP